MSFLWVHAECGYQRKTSWSYLSERIRKDKQPTAGLETYLKPLSLTVGVAQTEWSSHKRSKEYRSWFSLWLRRTFVGFDEQFNLQKELSSRNSATTEKRKNNNWRFIYLLPTSRALCLGVKWMLLVRFTGKNTTTWEQSLIPMDLWLLYEDDIICFGD